MTSDRELSIYSFGYPLASRRRLKFARHSSNVVFEEFVLSSLIALLLIKPLFTPGGRHEVKWVYLSAKSCEVSLCFVAIVRVKVSLFQALCQCGRLKKRSGNERSLVEKEGVPSPFHSRIPLSDDPARRPLAFSIVLTDQEPGTGYRILQLEKFRLLSSYSRD